MKKAFVYCSALAILAFGACKKDSKNSTDRSISATNIIVPNGGTVPSIINAGDTVRLTGPCNTYLVDGKVYVKSGGVIMIEPGVTVKGVSKTSTTLASALVITKGGKIIANGTATRPITFTSTSDSSGGWGGLVILGRSTVNKTNPTIEGIDLPSLPAGVDVTYGGSIPADNSGSLTYIKIINAGASISPNNELNGLTLGGVGSGTTIHHILSAKGRDDAFEIFGGTVNLKYIIAQSPNDDMFDFDQGYTGTIQFALGFVKTTENVFNADANGIESDNDATGSSDAPITRPVISNMTIIGGQAAAVSGTLYGSRWRRNSSGYVINSIIMGYNYAAFIDISSVTFKYCVLQGFVAATNFPPDPTNVIVASPGAVQLLNPYGTWCSNFDARPLPSSPAITNPANFSGAPSGSIFDVVTYRGAFPATNVSGTIWTAFACATCN